MRFYPLFLLVAFAAVSCTSTKSTIRNIDETAPAPVLKDSHFVLTEYSHDPKYGYDPDYPINIFYKSTKNDSINQPRFLNALAGPKGETITYTKLESCCPYPSKYSEMGVGTLDVYELTWAGQDKPVKLYLNIYGKGKVQIPMGLTYRP